MESADDRGDKQPCAVTSIWHWGLWPAFTTSDSGHRVDKARADPYRSGTLTGQRIVVEPMGEPVPFPEEPVE
jgi:hypothetical protein